MSVERRVFIGGVAVFIILALCVFELINVIKVNMVDNEKLHPVSSIVYGEETVTEPQTVTAKVYFGGTEENTLDSEMRQIPLQEAKKSTSNLATLIVNELIKGPFKDNGLKTVLPSGTKILSPVTVSGGVAVVNLSKEFLGTARNLNGQRLSTFSIVNTLTELKEVNKVKILVDGKTLKESKDNIKLDTPFSRNESLISDETKQTFQEDTVYVNDDFLE